ncbi:fumarylacetoacetase [Helicobacter valdiviensis]|uniref:Fumarylacetoacetase n=1 Tax=Helicobacter valdiviensis TaxID=1458358 RepID=A0A2W6PQJ4_9HELI|nr:fumarylacetoacetate hydrolase family protein [Helicobacter valdiviensis]PZT49003.1 fumarylacetoacetase [Helicobacter valdiviensis]
MCKIIRFLKDGEEKFGILEEEKIKVLEGIQKIEELFNKNQKEIQDLAICEILKKEVEILSPIDFPLQDVICLGVNYLEHAKESYKFKGEAFDGKREEAVYFSKRVNQCTKPYGEFAIRGMSNALDYEVELAFVVGKDCQNISKEEALDYVFGYSVANDLSARDLQKKHKQWYAGKSLEGALVLGPCVVLKESLNPFNLSIQSYVNGELRQNSNTKEMIFTIPHILSELSHYFMIKAGSLVITGTPSGAGMGFNPPKFLKAGDEVRCCIEGIGEIVTKIIE